VGELGPAEIGVEGTIWGRLLEVRTANLTLDRARMLLELDFTQEDRARMHELGQKAQAGTLTAAEQELAIDVHPHLTRKNVEKLIFSGVNMG
jgi:hypothetical protein